MEFGGFLVFMFLRYGGCLCCLMGGCVVVSVIVIFIYVVLYIYFILLLFFMFLPILLRVLFL